MAQECTAYWYDINGYGLKEDVTNSFWVASDGDELIVLQACKDLSNAAITKAETSFPVDATGITGNDATDDDVSTVVAKGKLTMSGYNAASTGVKFDEVKIGIPAPKGTLFLGTTGDRSNADVQGLMHVVKSVRGTQMDNVKKFELSR